MWSRLAGNGNGRPRIGERDSRYRDLYRCMFPTHCWDTALPHSPYGHHGAVFNLEFSPQGQTVVAACAKKSILVFDPLRGIPVNCVPKAHNDCVNCIRFLDSRMFATCSDDMTIALWDLRYLRSKIQVLRGHSNWVKNIEYAHDLGLLVSSGFDGSVYTWDINKCSENQSNFSRVFHTHGLMRTQLSPDLTKMVICTATGFMVIVHDLDLETLGEDLQGFKPDAYHQMQWERRPSRTLCRYNHLFTAKRNRVEFISDFPPNCSNCVISSLQIHPQGWCVLSRCTKPSAREWTCVHDIQSYGSDEEMPCSEGLSPDPDDSVPEFSNRMFANFRRVNEGASTSRGYPLGTHYRRRVNDRNPLQLHIRLLQNRRLQLMRQQRVREDESPMVIDGGDLSDGGGGSDEPESTRHSSSPSPPSTSRIDNYFVSERQGRTFLNISYRITSADEYRTLLNSLLSARSSRETPEHEEGNPLNDILSRPRVVVIGDNPNVAAVPDQRIVINPFENQLYTEPIHVEQEPTISAPSINVFDLSRPDNDDDSSDSETDFPNIQPVHSTFTVPIHPPPPRMDDGDDEPTDGSPSQSSSHDPCPSPDPENEYPKIVRNRRRLTHYIKEPGVGQGYIKELCFSSDGRIIFSPFTCGVRLLSFSPSCQEMSDCLPKRPSQLCELIVNNCHPNVVVSTKFSPTHNLLVSGCLDGTVCFHQPRLA